MRAIVQFNNSETSHRQSSVLRDLAFSRISTSILRVGMFVAFWILLAAPAISQMPRTPLIWSGIVFAHFLVCTVALYSEQLLEKIKRNCFLVLVLFAPVLPFFDSDLLRVLLASFVVFEVITGRGRNSQMVQANLVVVWCDSSRGLVVGSA